MFKVVDPNSLSKLNISQIHALVCKSFAGHFTSLLSQQQLKRYFFDMSVSASYAKCHLAFEGDKIVGFAVLGAEISLLSIFRKVDSVGKLVGVLLLCMKLVKNPRIFFTTIKNLKNRWLQGQSSDTKLHNSTYLAYICVDMLSENKGVGSQLLHSINQALVNARVPRVYCYMDGTSLQISRYYMKNGWVIESKGSTRSLAWCKVF